MTLDSELAEVVTKYRALYECCKAEMTYLLFPDGKVPPECVKGLEYQAALAAMIRAKQNRGE